APRTCPCKRTHGPWCPLIEGTRSKGCQFGVKPPCTQALALFVTRPNKSGIGGIHSGGRLGKLGSTPQSEVLSPRRQSGRVLLASRSPHISKKAIHEYFFP